MKPALLALISGALTSACLAQLDHPVPADAPSPAPTVTPATPAQPAKPAAKSAKPAIYDETADANAQIQAALAKAKTENRRVLIQWGANWCGWCHKLHDLCKKDKGIAKELLYEYDVVLVDVGQFDKHMDIANAYGADLKKAGLPFITILDATGVAIVNQETGSLEWPEDAKEELKKASGHDPEKVMAFLTKHQAAPRSAEQVLTAALDAAATNEKKVFFHVGAPWCGWCHRLEDWMAEPSVRETLGKDFVCVKIDHDRMTGAPNVIKQFRADDKGGIPWYAIIDPTKKNDAKHGVVGTSDAAGGNIGYPATEKEIEAFLTLIRSNATSISASDLDALKSSLTQRAPKPR